MAVNRYYSATAVRTTLSGSITNSAATLTVGSTAGFPSTPPFTLILDAGQPAEEVVTVTSVGGTTLTVLRGQDGTAALAHGIGTVVMHGMSARDLREPQEHIAANVGVHGVTSSVVGTTDAQGLTNKSINGLQNTLTNIQKASLPTDAVYTTAAQTLTAKTLDGTLNTFVGLQKASLPSDALYAASTNVVTAKTMSGLQNTFTNIQKSSLPGDVVYTGDTGWVTAGVVEAGSFDNLGTRCRSFGGWKQVDVRARRAPAAAALVCNSAGNFPDTTMLSIPAPFRPSGKVVAACTYITVGSATTGGVVTLYGDGQLNINSGSPSSNLVPGGGVDATFVFLS